MTMSRDKMRTTPGLSVRSEIDARIETARQYARSLAFDEAIAFLRLAGHAKAADDLDHAAFGQQETA